MDEQAIVIFGEVLFDHFPDGSRVLGGAPFNVAWHLQAFGLSPLFISRVGDYAPGREIIRLMEEWGMDSRAVRIDSAHPTGSVRVRIVDGEPHYDIVVDSAYDFIDAQALVGLETAGILYHGTLALRNPVSCSALAAIKARHLGRVFVDVNLRSPWWQRDRVSAWVRDADWVKLNQTELSELCPEQTGLEADMRLLAEKSGLDALIVTRGAQGAGALGHERQWLTVKPAVNLPLVDTVGAGDAFAAVLLLGFNKGWPLATTLERAQAFAGAIVGRRGATVNDRAFYSAFRRQWF